MPNVLKGYKDLNDSSVPDTKKQDASSLMYMVFDVAFNGMMKTNRYQKYNKIPFLVNGFKKSVFGEMKGIQSSPEDLKVLETTLREINMRLSMYFDEKDLGL